MGKWCRRCENCEHQSICFRKHSIFTDGYGNQFAIDSCQQWTGWVPAAVEEPDIGASVLIAYKKYAKPTYRQVRFWAGWDNKDMKLLAWRELQEYEEVI